MSTSGREHETVPLEYWGEPLLRLRPAATGAVGAQGPFRFWPLTVSAEFSGEAYPGTIERLLEMARNHPDYCEACEGFPCQGGHPPDA